LTSAVIQPGEVLFIPQAQMDTVSLRRALGTLFVKPVVGRLTSEFGMRVDPISGRYSMHYGVDWANVIGTPIRASNEGIVSHVGESRRLGKYVLIDHVEQYQTLYAHMSAWSVREGMRVQQGTIIGKVGNTGYSTGPHLHFAIYKNYEPVDPLQYVH
jgi:murein DD-endopeptidase MepM/ murein hydrolase activator NlpD